MVKDARPRWKHKCPTCPRIVYWERIYCKDCIKAYPQRANFRLSQRNGMVGYSSFRKGARSGLLISTGMTRDHIFAMIQALMLCVECGHKVHLNDVKHRCYFLTDAATRTLRLIRCRVCRYKKAKHLFPVFKRRGRTLRSRICSDCLHGSEFVKIEKRKYQRRATA